MPAVTAVCHSGVCGVGDSFAAVEEGVVEGAGGHGEGQGVEAGACFAKYVHEGIPVVKVAAYCDCFSGETLECESVGAGSRGQFTGWSCGQEKT